MLYVIRSRRFNFQRHHGQISWQETLKGLLVLDVLFETRYSLEDGFFFQTNYVYKTFNIYQIQIIRRERVF